jgi:hypothetical protein
MKNEEVMTAHFHGIKFKNRMDLEWALGNQSGCPKTILSQNQSDVLS